MADEIEDRSERARERFRQAQETMVRDPATTAFGDEIAAVGRMMFGVSGDELDEDMEGQVISWVIKGRPVQRLHRGAVRDAVVALSRLVLLYDAFAGSRGWFDDDRTGYLDTVTEACASGKVTVLAAACETLEASWHDGRLTREQGIEAVEAVEALRTAVRRLEACGLTSLSEFDASDPCGKPAMP